jgi:hypothetical protein
VIALDSARAVRQLVVQSGEQIVCPGCGAVLATFEEDLFGMSYFIDSAASAFGGPLGESNCSGCGEAWGVTSVRTGDRPRRWGDEPGPQIHLRSGAWTGWRALGGE